MGGIVDYQQVTQITTTQELTQVTTYEDVRQIRSFDVVQVYNSGAGALVVGETPSGTVNGSNATFTTAFDFVPESVEVFVETCRLCLLEDYNTSGTNTIQFYVSPLAGEKIRVNYQKQ